MCCYTIQSKTVHQWSCFANSILKQNCLFVSKIVASDPPCSMKQPYPSLSAASLGGVFNFPVLNAPRRCTRRLYAKGTLLLQDLANQVTAGRADMPGHFFAFAEEDEGWNLHSSQVTSRSDR